MAPEAAECYAIRALSPFRGVMHILARSNARAVSRDGATWRLILRQTLSVMSWGSLDNGKVEGREFSYGIWSQQDRLRRFPLNPLIDAVAAQEAVEALLQELAVHAGAVPYPAEDVLELWLLDAMQRLPLALAQSARISTPLTFPRSQAWLSTLADPGFELGGLRTTGSGRSYGDMLTGMVKREAGPTLALQWFRRRTDGSGLGLTGHNLDACMEGRELAAGAFPEIFIRETWEQADERALVAAYLNWQAPRLLTVSNLSRVTRTRLEREACLRPLEVQRYHRAYPEVVQRDLVNAALVEALLREAARR